MNTNKYAAHSKHPQTQSGTLPRAKTGVGQRDSAIGGVQAVCCGKGSGLGLLRFSLLLK